MDYLLLGAGLQGQAIAFDLLRHARGTRRVTVIDRDHKSLAGLQARFPGEERLVTVHADIRDRARIKPRMEAAAVTISAVPYWFNVELAELACSCRADFLDLGGNNDVVARQFQLDETARRQGVTILPDCGLAPGMAGILAYQLQAELADLDSLRIRVGGLPRHPRPPLDYQLTFAVQGLINEYVEPALVIRDGEVVTVPALTDVERLRFPAPYGELEAFHTSGGVSTLTRTLAGRARNLDYKTIRYPGHCQKMKLLFDLGLASSEPLEVGASAVSPREVLARLLERRLTVGPEEEDVVLVLIEADGKVDGRTVRKGLRIIDLADPQNQLSAMMRTTGFPAAIIAAMLAGGQIERRGALAQELVVPGEPFLAELARRRIQIERFENEVV